jgi:hypothetical protein
MLIVSEKLDSALEQQLQAGAAGCVVVEDSVYLLRRGERQRVCDMANLKSSGVSLLEALSAVAAAWAIGLSPETIQAGLGASEAGSP